MPPVCVAKRDPAIENHAHVAFIYGVWVLGLNTTCRSGAAEDSAAHGSVESGTRRGYTRHESH